MKDKLFVIWGRRSPERDPNVVRSTMRQRAEPNLDILKKSPCLHCELFTGGIACPYVKGCSKIDEFQRVAAVHCTLSKYQDVRSMA